VLLKNSPNRTTAHHVSGEYATAKTGNKVLRAQIIKNGPNTIEKIIIMNRITYIIFTSYKFYQKKHPLLLQV
jgi:hypothetical protein